MMYFDYAASNPIDPRVKTAMIDVLDQVGNPSSLHAPGRLLRARIDAARSAVAGLFGCQPSEIVFTSGATESNVMAVTGLVRAAGAAKPHVLASPIEHPSVLAALARMAERGEADVQLLPVDRSGRVAAEDVRAMMRPETALVCVMWANNVLGSIQPVEEIGAAVRVEKARRGPKGAPLFFFSDAVQAVPVLRVHPALAGVDAMSFSGHKMYGPKGIGGLYVRKGLAIEPLLAGGDQESGFRSGTENVAGIIGLGVAADVLRGEREDDARRADVLRGSLLEMLSRSVAQSLRLLGPEHGSLPGTLYFASQKDDGETLAMKLDVAGFAVSTGSACAAGARKPSRVLASVHDENTARRGGIRVSFGRFTSEEEVLALAAALAAAAAPARPVR
jgi:cysteine desulfurase